MYKLESVFVRKYQDGSLRVRLLVDSVLGAVLLLAVKFNNVELFKVYIANLPTSCDPLESAPSLPTFAR